MIKLYTKYCLIALFCFLAGCQGPITVTQQGTKEEIASERKKQTESSLRQEIKDLARVYDLAYPLLLDNQELCPSKKLFTGMYTSTLEIVHKVYKEAAKNLMNLGNETQIWKLVKNSAAEKAGLMIGDKIVGINGIKIRKGKNGFDQLAKLLEEITDANIQIKILRNNENLTFNIVREKICNYNIAYLPNEPAINAYADGQNIYITRGMYRFADDDSELSLVMAHELAHNTMEHIDKKKTNVLLGTAGGFLIDLLLSGAGVYTGGTYSDLGANLGAQAYSVGFEQEADYVAMYYLERAGIDSSNVAHFWRRMATEHNNLSINHRTSHPTTPERFIALEKTFKEIMMKKNNGEVLKPNIESSVD